MLVEAPSQHSRPKNSALGSVNKGVMIEARGYCLPILSCTLSSLTIQFKFKLYHYRLCALGTPTLQTHVKSLGSFTSSRICCACASKSESRGCMSNVTGDTKCA